MWKIHLSRAFWGISYWSPRIWSPRIWSPNFGLFDRNNLFGSVRATNYGLSSDGFVSVLHLGSLTIYFEFSSLYFKIMISITISARSGYRKLKIYFSSYHWTSYVGCAWLSFWYSSTLNKRLFFDLSLTNNTY